MHELTGVPYENAPLQLYEQRLLDALTLPAEAQAVLHTQFSTQANELIGWQLSPQAQQIVKNGLDLVEWELFGRPEDTLPDSLALYYNPTTGITSVDYAPHVPYREAHGAGVRRYIYTELAVLKKGLGTFWNKAGIQQGIFEVIKRQRAYTFIRSFEAEPVKYHEQPLSTTERLMREAMIRESIKKSGSYTDQDIGMNPAVRLPYIRELHHLEYETSVRGADEPADSAAERIKQLLSNTESQGGTFSNIIDRVMATAPNRPFQLPDMLNPSILYDFFIDFQKANPNQARVQEILDHASESMASLITSGIPDDRAVNGAEIPKIYNSMLAYLRRPRGILYINNPDDPRTQNSNVISSASSPVMSMSAVTTTMIAAFPEIRSDNTTVAEFAFQNKWIPQQRVVSFQRNLTDYPTAPLRYDAWVFLYAEPRGKPGEPLEPYIPGLHIVGRTGQRWFFAVDTEDYYNPSAAEAIPLDPEGVRRLASEYDAIGLHALADALKTNRVKSVADLVKYVGLNRDFPADASVPATMFNEVPGIATFAPHVRNGRLSAQCTTADTFMQSSYKIARPGCVTTSIGGLLLGHNDGLVSATGHVQTRIQYGNKIAITDPESSSEPAVRRLFARIGSLLIRGGGNAAGTGASSGLAPGVIEAQPVSQELYAKSLQIQIEDAKNRLEQALLPVLRAGDLDELYDRVVQLHKDEPVLVVLRAFDAAVQGQIGELLGAYTYLQEYAKADSTIHRTLEHKGFLRYDPRLADLLMAHLFPVVSTQSNAGMPVRGM